MLLFGVGVYLFVIREMVVVDYEDCLVFYWIRVYSFRDRSSIASRTRC